MKNYLCYYQLHVDDRTFNVHTIVQAENPSNAIELLKSQHGASYHLQAKGCSGEATKEEMEKYMLNYLIPEEKKDEN